MQYLVQGNRQQGEVLVRKLLPEGTNVEDVHLTAWQVAESVFALSVLGAHEYFEWEMELLLQVSLRWDSDPPNQLHPVTTHHVLYAAVCIAVG